MNSLTGSIFSYAGSIHAGMLPRTGFRSVYIFLFLFDEVSVIIRMRLVADLGFITLQIPV